MVADERLRFDDPVGFYPGTLRALPLSSGDKYVAVILGDHDRSRSTHAARLELSWKLGCAVDLITVRDPMGCQAVVVALGAVSAGERCSAAADTLWWSRC